MPWAEVEWIFRGSADLVPIIEGRSSLNHNVAPGLVFVPGVRFASRRIHEYIGYHFVSRNK